MPKAGARFVMWSDGVTENVRTVEVESDSVLVATFESETQGVEDVNLYGFQIDVDGLRIVVSNVVGERIKIFDEVGRCLISSYCAENVVAYNMSHAGVYLVHNNLSAGCRS